MNRNVNEVAKGTRGVKCDFCHLSKIRSLEWGSMYQLEGVTVHYFCLLFSTGQRQNGEDDEGILGFLPVDIRKELRRGKKLKCKFCKEPGATIGCSVKACKVSYHFPCGLKAKSSFQFTDNFESYCIQHKKAVEIRLPKRDWTCPICYSRVRGDPLLPPCCKKRVFHKKCILKMAKNHGSHFFTCPLCNDKDVFAEAMKKGGVYVPVRDATWETAPNAFEEHKRLYNRCDAQPDCHCPEGRDFRDRGENHPWSVVRCGACGASAIHKSCGKLENLTWRCPTCAGVLSGKPNNKCSINKDTDKESNPGVTETTPAKKDISLKPQVVDLEEESDSDVEVICEKPCPLPATNSTVFLHVSRKSRKPGLAAPPLIRRHSLAPVYLSPAFERWVKQTRYSSRVEGLKSGSVSDDCNSATSESLRSLRKRKK